MKEESVMKIPRVVAINDLSGIGKCSLAVTIPILSVMGVQACPLPTNVYSNQTGFAKYAYADLSEYMEPFCDRWKEINLSFSGIYSSFLSSAKQVDEVKRVIDRLKTKDTFVLIDPVLGDNGSLYPCFNEEMIDKVSSLIKMAQVITPNLTEACMLAQVDYEEAINNQTEYIWQSIAQKLCHMGVQTVIITGIPLNEKVGTFLYKRGSKGELFENAYIRGSYSGTGDILASVLCGGIARGESIENSLVLAHRFLERAISETFLNKTDPREGIAFEHHLKELLP